jgi:hypothetical protein
VSEKEQGYLSAHSGSDPYPKNGTLEKLYHEVIKALEGLDKIQTEGGDQLEACIASLFIVKDFIEGRSASRTATRSLEVLYKVLSEIHGGSKPDLIFKRVRKKGRPKGGSTDAIKGVASACYALLVDKMGSEDACKIVAKGLGYRGIKLPHRGKGAQEITPDQIKYWHYEIGGNANPMVKAIRDQILNGLETHPSGRQHPPELEVSEILDALVSKGF